VKEISKIKEYLVAKEDSDNSENMEYEKALKALAKCVKALERK
jgi:exonuclease VII small subunit